MRLENYPWIPVQIQGVQLCGLLPEWRRCQTWGLTDEGKKCGVSYFTEDKLASDDLDKQWQ